jgi:hypothetical protein
VRSLRAAPGAVVDGTHVGAALRACLRGERSALQAERAGATPDGSTGVIAEHLRKAHLVGHSVWGGEMEGSNPSAQTAELRLDDIDCAWLNLARAFRSGRKDWRFESSCADHTGCCPVPTPTWPNSVEAAVSDTVNREGSNPSVGTNVQHRPRATRTRFVTVVELAYTTA